MNIEIVDIPMARYAHGKWDSFFIKMSEASARGKACVVPTEFGKDVGSIRHSLFTEARKRNIRLRSSIVDGKLVAWIRPTID